MLCFKILSKTYIFSLLIISNKIYFLRYSLNKFRKYINRKIIGKSLPFFDSFGAMDQMIREPLSHCKRLGGF